MKRMKKKHISKLQSNIFYNTLAVHLMDHQSIGQLSIHIFGSHLVPVKELLVFVMSLNFCQLPPSLFFGFSFTLHIA